jgi:hypothetical protein
MLTIWAIIIAFLHTSCTSEISLLEPVHALETDADAEYDASEDELKCHDHDDCLIIDKGCCFHEKALAVNKERSLEVIKKIKASCRSLKEEFRKEKKAELCRFREGGSQWLINSSTQCQKEVAEPRLKAIMKEIKEPAEAQQKYIKDYQIWRETAGKCSIRS